MFRILYVHFSITILYCSILLVFLAFGDISICLCLGALFLLVVLLLGRCWNALIWLDAQSQQLRIWSATNLLKRLEKDLKEPRRTCWPIIIKEVEADARHDCTQRLDELKAYS